MGNRMKRGRKFKIGGDTMVQPPKVNSPTITGSVKGTYSQIKGIIDKVIFFVKSNFIFSLLTAILFIVYIYFFTTGVVTEEDLKSDEIKLTCDTYDDKCPAGKKKIVSTDICLSPDLRVDIPDLKKKARELGADDKVDDLDNKEDILSLIRKLPNNDLDNFKCNKANCCVDITQCDNYNCPDFYSLKKGDTVCAKTKCTSKECCDKNCKDYKRSCKGGTIKNLDSLCKSEPCLPDECCDVQKTCGNFKEGKQFNCKPPGKVSKQNPGTIFCPANKCTDKECCDDSTPPVAPGSKAGAPATGATTTGGKTCDDHTCPTGVSKIPGPNDTVCDPAGCKDSLCCDTS
jgi:hypothetical protein